VRSNGFNRAGIKASLSTDISTAMSAAAVISALSRDVL
jgi:hypothetical protein